jgi:peptide/nickel transport system permease protein
MSAAAISPGTATPATAGPAGDNRSRALRRFLRRRASLVALAVVVAFIMIALAAPWIAPYNPIATDFSAVRQAPSAKYWLGTDEVGRDLLSRLIWGARASLLAGVIPVTISLLVSIPLGLLSGYAGGWVDSVIMRFTDAMLAIPFLIIAIALAAFLGPSLTNAMIAIGVAALPTFLRLSRGTVLSIRTEDYIEAARAVGNTHLRIAVRHILPNMLPPLLIQGSITMAAAIIAEASLSFLGLGQQPPSPSWGSMLNAAQRYLPTAPWIAMFPGLMIFTVVFSLNILGDGLRDALDPKSN